jgi:hypothetical protein
LKENGFRFSSPEWSLTIWSGSDQMASCSPLSGTKHRDPTGLIGDGETSISGRMCPPSPEFSTSTRSSRSPHQSKIENQKSAKARFLLSISAVMRIYTLFRATALVLIAASLMPVAAAGLGRRNSSVPVVFSISPTPTYAGETISIDVVLDHTTLIDQAVDISTLTPGNWASLPSQVVVLAGHSDVVFNATLSKTASGILQGQASCNGGYVGQSIVLAFR